MSGLEDKHRLELSSHVIILEEREFRGGSDEKCLCLCLCIKVTLQLAMFRILFIPYAIKYKINNNWRDKANIKLPHVG